MSNSILQKRRTGNSVAPVHTELLLGELAINTMTGRLFMKDNFHAVIDLGTNVIDLDVNYNGANPVSITLDGTIRSDIILHKGLSYTFRIVDTTVPNLLGTDIFFFTQVDESSPQLEYTNTVVHYDHHTVIRIPQEAPANLKVGLREINGGNSTAMAGTISTIVYSDASGGGGGSSSEQLISSDAVFSWDTDVDVWETGADEGLKASSGKLVLGSVGLQSGSNLITFDSLTTLDNVAIDCGNFN